MPIGVGSIGSIGAIIVLVVGLFLGVDPSTLLALLITDQAQPRPVDVSSSRPPHAGHGRTRQFVAVVLADTEDVWKQVFRSSGKTYNEPKLVLYTGHISSACGFPSAA